MTMPTGAIEAAAIARLRDDTTLQSLLGATQSPWQVFAGSAVPTNTVPPYVVVFPITSQLGEDFSFGGDARDTFLQISVFIAPMAGMKQVRDIMGRIDALFFSGGRGLALDLSGSGLSNYLILPDNMIERPDGVVPSMDGRWKVQTQG